MIIFLGNLPEHTTTQDMARLFAAGGSHSRLRIYKKHTRDGRLICYGLAVFDSYGLLRKSVARLRKSRFTSPDMVVREYVHRAYGNERRALDWRDRKWKGEDRRHGERRYNDPGRVSQRVTSLYPPLPAMT